MSLTRPESAESGLIALRLTGSYSRRRRRPAGDQPELYVCVRAWQRLRVAQCGARSCLDARPPGTARRPRGAPLPALPRVLAPHGRRSANAPTSKPARHGELEGALGRGSACRTTRIATSQRAGTVATRDDRADHLQVPVEGRAPVASIRAMTPAALRCSSAHPTRCAMHWSLIGRGGARSRGSLGQRPLSATRPSARGTTNEAGLSARPVSRQAATARSPRGASVRGHRVTCARSWPAVHMALTFAAADLFV